MKKRMLLSTVLMTLVLLLAATTATFAWYTAGGQTSLVANATDSESISTAVNEYNMSGTFTVTVEFATPDGAPVLTDTLGKTYYYAGAVTGAEIPDNGAAPKSGSCAFTVKVTYSGTDNLTDAEIADLWKQVGKKIVVTVSDTSSALPSEACGLKFWSTNAHQSSWVDGAATVSYEYAHADLSFASKVATIGSGTVYYGAKGVDDVAQAPTDAYQMTATVSAA